MKKFDSKGLSDIKQGDLEKQSASHITCFLPGLILF